MALVPLGDHAPARTPSPSSSEDEKAGTFTRASEETLRQRRIVSVAGRFKGGGAPCREPSSRADGGRWLTPYDGLAPDE